MYKFKKLNNGQKTPTNADIQDFAAVVKLCNRYKFQLFDDFGCGENISLVERVANLVAEAGRHFWIIKRKCDDKFVGFVYLYDIVGGQNALYSGTIGTCFAQEFWGQPALICGRKFLKYCFTILNFKKLKGETFTSNPFIIGFLRKLNFKLEGEMAAETLLRGKPENLFVWGLTAENWQKEKGAKPLDYTSRSINNVKIIPFRAKKEKDY